MNSINIGFFSFRGDIEDGKETITQIQMQAEIEQIFMKFPPSGGCRQAHSQLEAELKIF